MFDNPLTGNVIKFKETINNVLTKIKTIMVIKYFFIDLSFASSTC